MCAHCPDHRRWACGAILECVLHAVAVSHRSAVLFYKIGHVDLRIAPTCHVQLAALALDSIMGMEPYFFHYSQQFPMAKVITKGFTRLDYFEKYDRWAICHVGVRERHWLLVVPKRAPWSLRFDADRDDAAYVCSRAASPRYCSYFFHASIVDFEGAWFYATAAGDK